MRSRVVTTWVGSGLKDLWFASQNQGHDVFRYGTFFFLMAAEEHLKGGVLHARASEYEQLSELEALEKATRIASTYRHDYRKMIQEVEGLRAADSLSPLLQQHAHAFPVHDLVAAMNETYMETRYPTPAPRSAARRFASKDRGVLHDPTGSSFFTDFIEDICLECSVHLHSKGLDVVRVIHELRAQLGSASGFQHFDATYLTKLEGRLRP